MLHSLCTTFTPQNALEDAHDDDSEVVLAVEENSLAGDGFSGFLHIGCATWPYSARAHDTDDLRVQQHDCVQHHDDDEFHIGGADFNCDGVIGSFF